MKFRQLRHYPYAREIEFVISSFIALLFLIVILGHIKGNPETLSIALFAAAFGTAIYSSSSIIIVIDYLMEYIRRKASGKRGRPKFVYTLRQCLVSLAQGAGMLAIILTDARAIRLFLKMTYLLTIALLVVFLSMWVMGKFVILLSKLR